MKAAQTTETREVVTTVEETVYTLTLDEAEADALRELLGHVNGTAPGVDLYQMWRALDDVLDENDVTERYKVMVGLNTINIFKRD